ncbi:MAG: hypothetical protein JO353_11105, partial [Phycisphaerae bacterium]|nr:hypothetical protein [Phycisphaerae bacterium]
MSVPRSPSYHHRSLNAPPRLVSAEDRKPIDWPRWLRLVERKRRLVDRKNSALLIPFLHLGTLASFRLEGIDVTESTILAAVQPNRDHSRFRSRCSQRIRSHIAILLHIERSI